MLVIVIVVVVVVVIVGIVPTQRGRCAALVPQGAPARIGGFGFARGHR